MDLPRHRVSLSEPASPVGLVLEPELAWAWGPGSIVSSLIGEPIRPVDQEGSLPPAIRTWGFLLPGKPGLSIRPARKPLFEQRDYCSGPLTVNSSRFGELPDVLGTGGSPTAQSWVTGRTMVTSPLESGFSRNSPADVAGPVQWPGLPAGTVRNSDTALHHPLVAIDKLQFGQPLQVLWVAHPLAGAPGGHFAVLPEEGGQPHLLVVFRRGRQASRLWLE